VIYGTWKCHELGLGLGVGFAADRTDRSFHAYGLGFLERGVKTRLGGAGKERNLASVSIIVMGGMALSAIILHAIESAAWAGAYRLVGAIDDNKSAMLYSLNAMTSYGHENLQLAPGWQ
jgi:hypothetical protein